ncbi:hypothetical protein [Paraburkholderia sp. J94]|uniref:hypothetical protein n=1 Tax=Paraburkholderia sp. J94 TaxID=2805441 RepID=UPI002AB29BB3|nr:hypothetical protein [Paraburkholderia sp. J94]
MAESSSSRHIKSGKLTLEKLNSAREPGFMRAFQAHCSTSRIVWKRLTQNAFFASAISRSTHEKRIPSSVKCNSKSAQRASIK